jgi:hypothetical protein
MAGTLQILSNSSFSYHYFNRRYIGLELLKSVVEQKYKQVKGCEPNYNKIVKMSSIFIFFGVLSYYNEICAIFSFRKTNVSRSLGAQ